MSPLESISHSEVHQFKYAIQLYPKQFTDFEFNEQKLTVLKFPKDKMVSKNVSKLGLDEKESDLEKVLKLQIGC